LKKRTKKLFPFESAPQCQTIHCSADSNGKSIFCFIFLQKKEDLEGLATASIAARPGLAIGPGGEPAI